MMKRLKEKWGITSNWQVLVICFIFAITGSSSLFVQRPVFALLGVTKETEWYIYWPLYLLIMFPSYQLLLLVYGFIFGQFQFFWNIEKKMLSRFGIHFKEKNG